VQDVDFSDRLRGANGKHKSYRVRRGGRERVYGDDSDDGVVEESRAQKIARLVREVEEMEAQLPRGVDSSDDQALEQQGVELREQDERVVQRLSKALRAMQTRSIAPTSDTAKLAADETLPGTLPSPQNASQAHPSQSTQAVEEHTSRVLSRAAALEARLSALESLVGSTTTDSTTTSSINTGKPMLSHLALLEKQVTTINTTNPPQLESMSSQIQQLLQVTRTLSSARELSATSLQKLQAQRSMGVPRGVNPALLATSSFNYVDKNASMVPRTEAPQPTPQLLEDPEHLARVDKLYSTLPSIEAALPVLPAIIERLRTLRFVHADAANARQGIKDLHKRQVDICAELTRWKEALDKVEIVIKEGTDTEKVNREEIEAWVKEMESRVKVLM
jgi:nuclear migration protein JNM1